MNGINEVIQVYLDTTEVNGHELKPEFVKEIEKLVDAANL